MVFLRRYISEVTERRVHASPKQEAFEKCWWPIRHCEPLHCHSPGVATVARRLRIDVHNWTTTTTTTTTTTRDRGDRYGPIEWAQRCLFSCRRNSPWVMSRLGESSTGEVQRLRRFCRRSCWVFAAPRRSERRLIAESVECWQRRGSNHLPSREAPV